MKKRTYCEGDWFAVPLGNDGFAVGLVARVAPKGAVLFGYFFGPRRQLMPTVDDVREFRPSDAVLVGMFGDLFLLQGRWPVIGKVEPWERARWPMPAFGRRVPGHDLAYRVEYPDDNPNGLPRETRITVEECQHLPSDGLDGARAVEITLAHLLLTQAGNTLPTTMPPLDREYPTIDYFLYLPTQAKANMVAHQLEAEGYAVEVGDSTIPEAGWLVRAKHDSPETDDELDAAEARMEDVATAAEGSYDGYERDVPQEI